MKTLMCAYIDHFLKGTSRGYTMLRLTGDGSPYQFKVLYFSEGGIQPAGLLTISCLELGTL